MNTFVFQPGATWRKVGFAFYSDSLAYREILDANPFWDITKSPVPGTPLYKPEDTGLSSGGLTQAGITTNVNITSPQASNSYYPFSSESEYLRALSLYTVANTSDIERYNGWTATSSQVISGIQG